MQKEKGRFKFPHFLSKLVFVGKKGAFVYLLSTPIFFSSIVFSLFFVTPQICFPPPLPFFMVSIFPFKYHDSFLYAVKESTCDFETLPDHLLLHICGYLSIYSLCALCRGFYFSPPLNFESILPSLLQKANNNSHEAI